MENNSLNFGLERNEVVHFELELFSSEVYLKKMSPEKKSTNYTRCDHIELWED